MAFRTVKRCSRQGCFELMSVNHSTRIGDIIGIVFSSFSNMKVCCLFSLESPHYQHKKENQNTIMSAAMR